MDKIGCGCLIVIIFFIVVSFNSCTNFIEKKSAIDIVKDSGNNQKAHNANDINNMLFDGIPPGDERRQKIATENLKAEKYVQEKMNILSKEISIYEDRLNMGVEKDANKLAFMKAKYRTLANIKNGNYGHTDMTKKPYYCIDNFHEPVQRKECEDKWVYNTNKLFWEYVHAQEYLDKGSITQEGFNTIEKRILEKDNATIKEIDKIMDTEYDSNKEYF